MKMYVVAIIDTQIGVFSRPSFVRSEGEARRGFVDEVNRKPNNGEQNPLNQHPEDFALYHLGLYDDETGRFEMPERPQLLCSAKGVMQ